MKWIETVKWTSSPAHSRWRAASNGMFSCVQGREGSGMWTLLVGWVIWVDPFTTIYIYTVYRLSSSKPTCPHQKSWVDDFPAFQFGWDMWLFPGAVYLLRLDALQEQARLAQQIDVQHLGGSGRSTGYFFWGVCNFKMNLRFLVMQMTMDHYPPWN